jgi:uncharacterized protein YycO
MVIRCREDMVVVVVVVEEKEEEKAAEWAVTKVRVSAKSNE